MKYEVQVIRTIREYAIVEVEADDPRRARAAAILETKANPSLFCDDEITGHKVGSVSEVK